MYEQAYKMLGGKIALMSNLDSSLDVIRKGLPIAMVDTAIKLLDMNRVKVVEAKYYLYDPLFKKMIR